MIVLKEKQLEFYSILLDMISRNPTGSVMANLLMRCGKTAIGMKIADSYNKVVYITDQPPIGHHKLIADTHLKLDQTIFFLNQNEIDQISDDVDLIILDDIDHYIELNIKCPKVYMYAILNNDFIKNIKPDCILSYTYKQYLEGNNKPVLELMQRESDWPKVIAAVKSQKQLMKKYLILIIGTKQETYDKLGDFANEFMLLYSDDYSKVKQMIYNSNKNIILCSKMLYKNISIPHCQFVICQNFENVTLDNIIQASFRGMTEFPQKEVSYVMFMNKKHEKVFKSYFDW